jgi:hypothetical protein
MLHPIQDAFYLVPGELHDIGLLMSRYLCKGLVKLVDIVSVQLANPLPWQVVASKIADKDEPTHMR